MSTKIISLNDFAYLILNLYQNIPADQRATIKRVIGWIRTAHKVLQDCEYDESIVKLAIANIEEINHDGNGVFLTMGQFIELLDYYQLNTALSFKVLPMTYDDFWQQ